MKARERHHLKDNELALSLAAARDYIEPRRKQLGIGVFAICLVVVAIAGFFLLRGRTQGDSERLLAEAMVVMDAQVIPNEPIDPKNPTLPAAAMAGTGTYTTEAEKLNAAVPKLKAAADAHPDTPAGITARYRMAGALAVLGKHAEASQAYDDVIKRDGEGLYGRMARFGKAEEQARAGQLDAAIATYKELSERKDADLPMDAILMQLARAYTAAGKKDEAQKTFTKIVDEHPDSTFAADAREALESFKS